MNIKSFVIKNTNHLNVENITNIIEGASVNDIKELEMCSKTDFIKRAKNMANGFYHNEWVSVLLNDKEIYNRAPVDM